MIYNDITAHYNNEQILDVGCGNCELLDRLSCFGCKVSGVDASAYRVLSNQQKHRYIYLALAEYLPLDSESVDIIISQECLEHVFDLEQALSEMQRVLKIGGKLFIQVPYKNLVECENHLRLFSKDSLQAIVSKYFNITYCEVIPYLNGQTPNNIYLKAIKE